MKKKSIIVLLLILPFFFSACSRDKSISINENCSIQYYMDPDSHNIQTVKICNGTNTVILYWGNNGTNFKLENNDDAICQINFTDEEGLVAYQLLDDKKDFNSVLNLYKDGSTSFIVQTSAYSEITNVLPDEEDKLYSQKQIIFNDEKGYMLDLYQDGKNEIRYKDKIREN
jgi:hypothetical protein